MSCESDSRMWRIYHATLHAAGFRTILPLRSIYALDEPRVERALDLWASEYTLEEQREDGTVVRDLTRAETREHFRREMAEQVVTQEFILAFPDERKPNTTWHDAGIQLDAFRPIHLARAFTGDCPPDTDPALVNSVFRPTMPDLELLTLRFP
jgi:hypothetical protein